MRQRVIKQLSVICAVSSLLISSLPIEASESQAGGAAAWQQSFDAGNKAYANGQYQEAERLLSQSAAAAEALGANEKRLAASLNSLALVYDEQGKFTQADSMYRRALSIFESTNDEENVAAVLNNIADLYRQQGKFKEAEPLCNRALEIRTRILGENKADTATSMNNLALIYYSQNKYALAEPLLLHALAVWKNELGPNNPRVASCMNNLALLYSDQGKYPEARDLYENAVAINKSSLGANHPSTAASVHNLASLDYAMGRYKEAESLYQQALSAEQQGGLDNLRFATSLEAIGSLAQYQGDLTKAINSYQQAISIRSKLLGIDNEATASLLNRLAGIEIDVGNYPEAERLYNLLLERDTRLFGNKDPKVASDLDNLAKIYKLQHKEPDAQRLKQQAIQIKEKLPGGLHAAAEQELGDSVPSNQSSGTGSGAANKNHVPVRDKWALVVGISNFQDPSINLRFAAKDATDFSRFLIHEENFKPDHVKLLTDENATREKIIGCLGDKWLRRVARKDDLVVVYLSTHGSNSKREAVGVNFVVAYDTNKDNLVLTGLPMDWLMQGIKDGVRCDRSILFLDVCHSGAAAPAEKGLERENLFKVADLAVGSGQIVLASSESDQISWESKQYPNGVFTHCLIEGLRKHGLHTTIQEAYSYMREKVEEEVLRDRGQLQTPVCRRAWSGDDAVLSIPPANPQPGLAVDQEDKTAMPNTAMSKSIDSKRQRQGTGGRGIKPNRGTSSLNTTTKPRSH